MIRHLAAAVAAVAVCGVLSAEAQVRGTARSSLRLVRAQCPGLPPGPCTPSITFSGGTAQLKRVKQPRAVSNTEFGKVNLNGVSPIPASTLTAIASGTQTYGADPDADCPLANSQVTGPFGTSTMTCIPQGPTAKCRGKLFFNTATAVQCSDVLRTITDINIEVYDSASVGDPAGLIATPGMAILGRIPDCDSGGAGCP